MKKITLILAVLTSLFLTNCGDKDLSYDKLTTGAWVGGDVASKKEGARVMWFQFFDQHGKENSYEKARDTVLGYPAKVFKDKHIWILINDRFEIRLMADSKNESYQSTEKLTSFLSQFDLKGMEAYKGEEQLRGKDLIQFIPKIEGIEKK